MKKSVIKNIIKKLVIQQLNENMMDNITSQARKIAPLIWKDVVNIEFSKELNGEFYFNIDLKSGQKQQLKKGKDNNWYHHQSAGEWPNIKNQWVLISSSNTPSNQNYIGSQPIDRSSSVTTAKNWDPDVLGKLKMKR